MNALRPYVASFRAWFQTAMQYKIATIMGFFTQIWFGAIFVAVYYALYSNHVLAVPPINLTQTITYVWLQQALFRLLPYSCDTEVANSIRSGTIVYDRIRPLDTHTLWLTRTLAKRVGRTLPLFILSVLLVGFILHAAGFSSIAMSAPASAISLCFFIVSTILGVAISASLGVLMDVLAAAMLSPAGVNAASMPLVMFLSGNIIPLPLFPDFAKYLAILQPFASLIDIPIRIYMGSVATIDMPVLLTIQMFWLVILIAVGRFVMARTMMRLEIQGG